MERRRIKSKDWSRTGLQERFAVNGIGFGLILDFFIEPRYSQFPSIFFYILIPVALGIWTAVSAGQAYDATKQSKSKKPTPGV